MIDTYFTNSNTIIKYLKRILNEITPERGDFALKCAYVMKRYCEAFGIDVNVGARLGMLCILKDIGEFHDNETTNLSVFHKTMSMYTFLKYASPMGEYNEALLYFRSIYNKDMLSKDMYRYGQLISLVNQVVVYDYKECGLDEMETFLREKSGVLFIPEQVENMIKLLNKSEIIEQFYNKSPLYAYEASSYISKVNYSNDELLGFIKTTNFAVEFQSSEILAHTVITAVIARELAYKSRLAPSQISEIYIGALVHDIGKIRIPSKILRYPGKLEGEALEVMRKHVEYSYEILENSFSYRVIDIARNHHERIDGSGYPRGLQARDLSIGDKIVQVADMASALYCKRSYKESFSPEKIKNILIENKNSGKLEGRLVDHYIDSFDEIMSKAIDEENLVLDNYRAMQDEYYELLSNADLQDLFVGSEIDDILD